MSSFALDLLPHLCPLGLLFPLFRIPFHNLGVLACLLVSASGNCFLQEAGMGVSLKFFKPTSPEVSRETCRLPKRPAHFPRPRSSNQRTEAQGSSDCCYVWKTAQLSRFEEKCEDFRCLT